MALEVDIRKRLGDFQLDVRFSGEREVLALLGASGCGKSMTLKCIAGIETPDAGTIVLDGRVLYDGKKRIHIPPQKRRVGYLFQQYALFPHMNVVQNIVCGVPERRKRKEVTGRWIKAMRLEGMEEKYPFQLSGGQQQRVALARILANEPEMLMLDEPFSALDSYLRWQVEMELSDVLKEYGRTTLFVSHNRDEVYRLCDRVCIINDGTSEPVMTVQALFEQPRTLSAALLSGCKNFSDALRLDAQTVQATDWGIRLRVREAAAEADCIGVRAHHVVHTTRQEGENVFLCRITRVVQDVFSTIVVLRPSAAGEAGHDIRLETNQRDTEGFAVGQEIWIRIDPGDIMLLTKEAKHE